MDLKVQADRIEWAAEAAVAEGHVVLLWGDQRMEAERAGWSPAGLWLERGHWDRPEESLYFERAEILLPAEDALLYEARLSVEGAQLLAGRLELGKGKWEGEEATLQPCSCEDGHPPAVSFYAREFRLLPGRKEPETPKVLLIQGGQVRLFRLPVLPIPWARIILDSDRFRLKFPEVGYSSHGWSLALAGKGGIHGWTIQAGPVWREDRGFLGLLSVEGPSNWLPLKGETATEQPTLDGALGWDQLREKWRGALHSEGGAAWGGTDRLAWDVTAVTDSHWQSDYGADWVQRGVRWQEQRGLLELGPSRLEAWAADDGSAGPLFSTSTRMELSRRYTLRPSVGISLFQEEGELRPEPAAGLELGGGGTWGPIHASLSAGSLGTLRSLDQGDLWAAGEGQLDLSVWGRAKGIRAIWWPGIRMKGLLGSEDPEEFGLGPGLGLQLNGHKGLLSGNAQLLWTDQGWEPSGWLWLDIGKIAGNLDLRPDLQQLRLRWKGEPLALGLSTSRSEELWLGRVDGELAWRRLRLGSELGWDFLGMQWSGAKFALGYDDGCSVGMLRLGLAPDRKIPDLSVVLELRK